MLKWGRLEGKLAGRVFFFYLFLAVLVFFAARGLSLVAVLRLLIVVASLVVEHGL